MIEIKQNFFKCWETELVFFYSTKHQLDYDNIYKNFNGVRLNPVDYIKYLGMVRDKNFNWNYHVHNLSISLSRSIT